MVAVAGVLLALERLDDARLHTPEAAWLKDRTPAITRTPTSSGNPPVSGRRPGKARSAAFAWTAP
ncbi:hypothetical protein [Methylobacterium sp. J-030]|uniref:hypothetical protein n=1 Tax=Methylobacterium sp. J-030 TaxID=2836627 RepID=UPI00391A715D